MNPEMENALWTVFQVGVLVGIGVSFFVHSFVMPLVWFLVRQYRKRKGFKSVTAPDLSEQCEACGALAGVPCDLDCPHSLGCAICLRADVSLSNRSGLAHNPWVCEGCRHG